MLASSSACPAVRANILQALQQQGDALFAHRRYDDACIAYHAALKIDPSSSEMMHAAKLAGEAAKGGVWLLQIMPGRDVALTPTNPEEALIFGAAASMKNLMYLVGDATSRECYAVDACWDPVGIMALASHHRMTVVGAICTHGHFDHAGGSIPPSLVAMVYGPLARHKFDGHRVPGLREMGRDYGLPLYCHAFERELISSQCALELEELLPIHQSTTLQLGSGGLCLEILHTPGHSSGSICISVLSEGRTELVLVGDTVFPGSCGRLDLPDSDKDDMYGSFMKLRKLDESVKVYPGHSYAGECTTIGEEKRGGLLREFSKEEWLCMHDEKDVDDHPESFVPSASPFAFMPKASAERS